MPSLPDPSRIPNELWELEYRSSDGLREVYTYWDRATGLGFRKVLNLVEADLLEANRQSLNDSYGQRFRDDPVGTRIASIPLNIFFRDIAPRLKEGDTDHMKWWLNKDDNRPYRTFRGRI